ncbi:hypothetical protein [Marinomonas mediterranea]|jgi:hypothetical protein|uniref:Uncharacterized protein n=1 Tax=Marinomonas mediterranea (strain ATCC 700492 / JCM 21426 / NBRC 103028 / MMB-1) TaxID=717774 RepID=F2JV52_MARM1|nr:hypothetical protein [Marinomonas mediterranea]ADZ92810.1 hypothetical protein Marme_3597 [Marinomonas mediterranea MMB-1]WCN10743.1 hypothetical protein GV055_18355 [Marinomonas mediterranea]WCN14800.1 hypothetical protein GV054_18230 [Marinomonas mediterranea]WCN18833.1 hypothetical protein GV053_18220 [Marinomonas mediterranea MMB-1]
MSDIAIQTLNTEPDEAVLTNALRNQDDIPILMDVVGGSDADDSAANSESDVSSLNDAKGVEFVASTIEELQTTGEVKTTAVKNQPLSQEAYFSKSMDGEALTSTAADDSKDKEHLEAAIKTVLEQKLPELITDVLVEYAKRKG